MPHRNIYIFGGHPLAVSYFEDLRAAGQSGALPFQDLFCIDADPSCKAAKLYPDHFILKSPADFIRDALHDPQIDRARDTIIPDHTAKHIFLQVFLDLARQKYPDATIALSPLSSQLTPPFLHKSEDDAVWAISYATWACPPECDEPEICPHTEAKRDWDWGKTLQELKSEQKDARLYLFACQIIHKQIAEITLSHIIKETERFLADLSQEKALACIVGTHSHCHGILGKFTISKPYGS